MSSLILLAIWGTGSDRMGRYRTWERGTDFCLSIWPAIRTNASTEVGGAIQVMLSGSLCYSRPGAEIEERGGEREQYGTQRRMPPVWLNVVQEERPYSYGQTKSPLQTVWPGFC